MEKYITYAFLKKKFELILKLIKANIFMYLRCFQMTVIHMFTRPCNISLQTVQAVPGCPDSLTSYQVAVKRKNCTAFLPIAAGCESLFYHCVLSDDNTHLVEVCAPTLNIIGID